VSAFAISSTFLRTACDRLVLPFQLHLCASCVRCATWERPLRPPAGCCPFPAPLNQPLAAASLAPLCSKRLFVAQCSDQAAAAAISAQLPRRDESVDDPERRLRIQVGRGGGCCRGRSCVRGLSLCTVRRARIPHLIVTHAQVRLPLLQERLSSWDLLPIESRSALARKRGAGIMPEAPHGGESGAECGKASREEPARVRWCCCVAAGWLRKLLCVGISWEVQMWGAACTAESYVGCRRVKRLFPTSLTCPACLPTAAGQPGGAARKPE
jgi:hypothetical protein